MLSTIDGYVNLVSPTPTGFIFAPTESAKPSKSTLNTGENKGNQASSRTDVDCRPVPCNDLTERTIHCGRIVGESGQQALGRTQSHFASLYAAPRQVMHFDGIPHLWCRDCEGWHPTDAFYRFTNPASKSNRMSICIKCDHRRRQARRLKARAAA